MSKRKKTLKIRGMHWACSPGAIALHRVGVRAEYAVRSDSPRNGMVLLTEAQAVDIALALMDGATPQMTGAQA
jgi:hypothetical protein